MNICGLSIEYYTPGVSELQPVGNQICPSEVLSTAAELKSCSVDHAVYKAENIYYLDLPEKVCQPLPYSKEKE